MKLLLVIPSMKRGGAERVASLLCQAWSPEHEVVLALFDTELPAYAMAARVVDLQAPGGRGLPRTLSNPVLRVWRLARLIRRERPDRIISFMESANFPACLAAWMAGAKGRLTVSVHNNPDAFTFAHRRLIAPLYNRLAARVVAVSNGVAESLRALGVAHRLLAVIPNPVDEVGAARLSTVAPPGALSVYQPYVLGVGRLHPQKGFDLLITAFSSLDIPGLNLVILGEGPERPRLEGMVRQLGLSGRVWMPGAVDNPFPFFRLARCFVLSSRYEGFGNVLVEAMATGCPVVAFDCAFGPAEIVDHMVDGVLVPLGRVDDLARAIALVLADDGLQRRLVDTARTKVAAWSVTRTTGRWLEG